MSSVLAKTAALCAITYPTASAAQHIVIGSGTPQHPVGQRVSDDALLSVAPNQYLRLLSRAGTRMICGPFRGRLGSAVDTCPPPQAGPRIRAAGERGDGPLGRLFDLMHAAYAPTPVDFCVNPDGMITSDGGSFDVYFGERPNRVTARWPLEDTRFRPSRRVRIRDGLLVRVESRESPELWYSLRLKVLPQPVLPSTQIRPAPEGFQVAEMLRAKGCLIQEKYWIDDLALILRMEEESVLFDP